MVMHYSHGERPTTDDIWFWMIDDGHMITGDECDPKFPDICLTVEGKSRKKTSTRKLTRQGIEPGPAAMLFLDHSGGLGGCGCKGRNQRYSF